MSRKSFAVDTAHSRVEFEVRHMMVSKVRGEFTKYEAVIEADPADLTTADIAFKVDMNSIDTRNEDRDNHLRSGDFFEIDKHPEMTFTSAQIVKKDDNEYEVTGNLSIKGVTKSETFDVEYEGAAKDPWGNMKHGFSVEGSISRKDYGMEYNAALETGGVLIGDKIKINLDLETSEI